MKKAEWEADEKLKKAHAETEKALDALLLTRAEFGKEQVK